MDAIGSGYIPGEVAGVNLDSFHRSTRRLGSAELMSL